MLKKLRSYLVAKRVSKQMRELVKLRDALRDFNQTMKEEVIPTMTALHEGAKTAEVIALVYGQATKACR